MDKLTNEHWAKLEQAYKPLANDTDYREMVEEYGEECPSRTRETIEQIEDSRNTWSEYGQTESRSQDCIIIRNAQVVKGQRRHDLAIVDLGDFRAIIKY